MATNGRDASDDYMGLPLDAGPEVLRALERLIWTHRPQVVLAVGVAHAGTVVLLRDRLLDAQRYRSGPAPRVVVTAADADALRPKLAGLPPEASACVSWEAKPAIREDEAVLLVLDVEGAEATTACLSVHGLTVGREGAILLLRADRDAVDRWRVDDPVGRRFAADGATLVRSDPL